jgi:transposase
LPANGSTRATTRKHPEMTSPGRARLTHEQWEIVRPLLPAPRVIRNRPRRIRRDCDVFAVMAVILVKKLPWSAGTNYGVSGSTLRARWAEWNEANVFRRLERSVDGSTRAERWALTVASAAAGRADRAGYHPPVPVLPAGPSPAEHRAAWAVQNAFAE